MKRLAYIILACSLWTAASVLAGDSVLGEPDPFYRVYSYDTPLTGWLEPQLWTTYIGQSGLSYDHFGQQLSREGLWAHSTELEYGLSDHLSLGGYFDFEDPNGGSFQFTDARIETEYRLNQRYDWPINVSLDAQYYLPVYDYSDSQGIETRLILDRDFGDFRIVLNPIFSKDTTGSAAGDQLRFSTAAGIYWRRYLRFQPGLEYYSDFGEMGHIPGFNGERHTIFGTLDIMLTKHVDWQIGIGGGLTGQSDDLTVKSIITINFDAINPNRWFHHEEYVP